MSVQTLIDADLYTIAYDQDVDAVVHQWDSFVSGDRFREGCETLLEVIEDRGASKLLVDSREITALDRDDVGWMFENWIPRTLDAGVTATVTVHPESAIAEMSMNRLAEEGERFGDAAEAHVTTDMGEARRWLRER